MAINNDDNKKLPETPGKVTGQKDVRYFTIHHSVDGTGSQHYAPFDLGESKQYSFDESWTSTGGYQSREAHKKTEMTTSLRYEHRAHNIGGHSQTGEASGQSYFNDTFSATTVGDSGYDVGGNKFSGIAKNEVKARNGGLVETNNKNSSNPRAEYSSGDRNIDTDGSSYNSVGQSRVSVVKKDDVTIVSEGDKATHIQKGSYDLQVSTGKLHMMTSSDELIANSNVKVLLQVGPDAKITIDLTKIKLQVGGGSYIEITSGGIKMVSPRIDLN